MIRNDKSSSLPRAVWTRLTNGRLTQVWVFPDGSEAAYASPLKPGEVDVDVSDLDRPIAEGSQREVVVSRTITPRMDSDELIKQLEIERLIASRRRK